MRVLIIGGGVIGTTTAYFLSEAGHQVTLIDRRSALAAEGSFANGGMLHAGSTEPWNSPTAVRQLIRWIGREDSPLLLRPAHIPFFLSWGLNFLRYSRPAHHHRHARINARLAAYSQRQMRSLRERTALAYDDTQHGIVKIFRDAKALRHALAASQLVADLGIPFQSLNTDALIELEPALADIRAELVGGIYYPADEAGDACLFTQRLGKLAADNGVEIRLGETVRRIVGSSAGITHVRTDRSVLSADCYILAAGVDAPRLAYPLGIKLPIEPVKGYSATLPANGLPGVPHIPLIDDDRRIVITRLGDRLRVAGTAEFAGYDRTIRSRRVAMVIRQSLATLPRYAASVDTRQAQRWACLRPMTPDGPPILGRTPVPNLLLNVGAGYLGWTFAAGAARIVADLVDDRTPEIDLEGLTLERYLA